MTTITRTYNPNATHTKAANLKISPHAKQRAMERFGISKECEIKKLAAQAKNLGIRVWTLNYSNYKALGLDWNTYRYLLNKYAHHYNTDKSYYYKDKVFVFGGQKSTVLKSIIPCTEEMVTEAIEKMEKDFHRYEMDKVKERLGE